METTSYMKYFSVVFVLMMLAVKVFSQAPVPTITGPVEDGIPATLSGGLTPGQIYSTEPGMNNYLWSVSSPAGQNIIGLGTNSITVDWVNPTSQQTVSVSYTDPNLGKSKLTVLIINYFPFAESIDPAIIPQFVDPLPHFAAGLRVNAKAGGNLIVKAVPVKQVALSKGTVLANGTIGNPATPDAGKGNYAAYQISYNGGAFGPAMWPAQTIEAQQGFPLKVQYQNELAGVRYADFNILADQTLMMNGYTLNGNPLTDPYDGPIPMVVHLHGGEMPSGSDGGPNSWFMPRGTTGVNTEGPGFAFNASSLSSYPNQQEASTLWYHPHDDGLTRINVYTGLAGYYFLRGQDEEKARVPGWSGDDLVQEVAPTPDQTTFNAAPYLPEIEIAIQDRMFNVKGELFWPVAPTNPELHPFWTPEFVGDVMTVNGKSWPYLSVAPRKYRFRMLEGCNARFLNMWFVDATNGQPGPIITVIGGEGGLLQKPVHLDPNASQTLLMAPGQRYDVIVDFTGLAGKTYTLVNNAGAPYPDGDPVDPLTTGRIMQFVVNGNMVSATAGTTASRPADKSQLPANLRPVTPLVKLTDFAGNLMAGVKPDVKRHIVLNEVMGANGPASVLVNNAYFDAALALPGTPGPGTPPHPFGGPTEIPREGTTEIFSIINISADAHPIHIHLLQWQLVSRQAIDVNNYMDAYKAAWNLRGLPEFPAGMGYPGGAGSPYPYDTPNAEGALGGNPEIKPFLLGPVLPANPEENGWKDNIIVMPGEVTTFVVRVAPTDRPVNATPAELMFPFDPSLGPGYVWHCHIVDHEDMSMMRPLPIAPSPLRFPQITVKPAPVIACNGLAATFSVTATSATAISYQWQLLGTGQGATWTNLTNVTPYSGVTTASLKIQPATLLLTNNKYRVILTNASGVTTSNEALFTVNQVPSPTITSVPGFNLCRLGIATYTTESGQSNYLWTIPGKSGTDYIKISGGTSTSNDLKVSWLSLGSKTVKVNYTNISGCTAAVPASKTIDVANWLPARPGNFTTSTTNVCRGSSAVYTVPPIEGIDYQWSYLGGGATITGSGNSVTVNYSNNATSGILSVRASNGCSASLARWLGIIVTNPPAMPAFFTVGSVSVSQGQSNIRYTVPSVAGLTYNWSYSGMGATITGTSNSVLISFSKTATSGTLSVTASNNCATSAAISRDIVVNNLKAAILPGDVTQLSKEAPLAMNELKAYPNPTSGAITFDFRLSDNAKVTLDITSMNGQRIARIFDADVEAGITQTVLFEKSLPAGTYLYYLRWNDLLITGKFIKIR